MEDASGLFNAVRIHGGSFGLAAVATLRDQRMTLHGARLEESISANGVIGQTGAKTQALFQIYEAIQAQPLVTTYSHLYFVLGVAMFVMIPGAFLLKPWPKTQACMVGPDYHGPPNAAPSASAPGAKSVDPISLYS